MRRRVIFICCATYHLIVALYYAMRVDWKNTEKILIWQNNTNACVDTDLFRAYFDRVISVRGKDLVSYSFLEQQRYKLVSAGWLFGWSEIGRLLRERKVKNIIVAFNDMTRLTDKVLYSYGKKKNNQIILVEEGIGTYYSKNNISTKRKLGNLLLGLKEEIYIGHNPYIDTVIVHNPKDLPDYLVKGRKVITQNNPFIDDSWIGAMGDVIDINYNTYEDSEKKTILWIGQPLSPDIVTAKREEQTLQKLFSYLSSLFTIIVKMHPRELKEKYSSYIEQGFIHLFEADGKEWISVELIASLLKPYLIITPLSSAPLNMTDDVKICYCYNLFGIENLATNIKGLIAKRKNTYSVSDLLQIKRIAFEEPIKVVKDKTNTDKDIVFFEELIE